MVSDAPINPTQLAGLLAFGIAAVAAAYAALVNASSRRSASAVWRGISIFQLLFFAEIWLGTRHALHDIVNTWLVNMGSYQDRALLQKWLLVALAISGAMAGMAWWRTKRRNHSQSPLENLGVACTAAVVLLFLMETVSLHAIDRVLYLQLGPVLLIAYAWMASAAAVTGLAWRAAVSRH